MDAMPVFGAYLLIAIALIALLIFSSKKNQSRLWIILIFLEVIATVGAYAAIHIFSGLPGHGEAPGLTYFSEVIYSIFACGFYAVQCFASIVVLSIIKLIAVYKRAK